MGATYTRQSTFTDGDIIQASDSNDEFDQLLAAFAAGSGHTHDGTTGEGGPISTLAGHALTFGQGTAGTDIVITFDGETNDGTLKWMEDEDYFEFSDDILIASTEKIQFGDTATFIQQSSDGVLRMRRGEFGEVKYTDEDGFQTELRGLCQAYSQQLVELYQPDCRVDLGDSKCKIELLPDVVLRITS